jgi:hypothetical protein
MTVATRPGVSEGALLRALDRGVEHALAHVDEMALKDRIVEAAAGRGHLRRPGPRDLDSGLLQRGDEGLSLARPVHRDRGGLVLGHQAGDLIDDPRDALSLVEDLDEDALVVHPAPRGDD